MNEMLEDPWDNFIQTNKDRWDIKKSIKTKDEQR